MLGLGPMLITPVQILLFSITARIHHEGNVRPLLYTALRIVAGSSECPRLLECDVELSQGIVNHLIWVWRQEPTLPFRAKPTIQAACRRFDGIGSAPGRGEGMDSIGSSQYPFPVWYPIYRAGSTRAFVRRIITYKTDYDDTKYAHDKYATVGPVSSVVMTRVRTQLVQHAQECFW